MKNHKLWAREEKENEGLIDEENDETAITSRLFRF